LSLLLSKLRVFHYRNLAEDEITVSPSTNLFLGPNGQGKTNLLEAIYLLGYGRSFRTPRLRDCIQHGKGECSVGGTVACGEREREVQVVVSPGARRLLVHGKEVPLDRFLGNLHVFAITHEHLSIVRGAPSERRAFLDRALVTLSASHVRHLAAYHQALRQRNRVLASVRAGHGILDQGLLESWEESLVRDGARILARRMRYIQEMREKLPAGLFGRESVELEYLSTVAGESLEAGDAEQAFRNRLAKTRTADLRLGFTSVGPHRDDLRLTVDGKALADFGSAGQQRSALLSLYFAQMEIHRTAHGFYPIFVVDDVEAELDDERLASFLAYVAERTQTFLTAAKDTRAFALPGAIRQFKVNAGKASAV
jgi:DNA replication and repair protein RecF